MTANPIPPFHQMSGPSGMPPTGGSGRFKPVDPIKLLRAKFWWLIAAGIVGAVIGIGLWVVLLFTMPRYASYTQMNVQLQGSDIVGSVSPTMSNQRMELLDAAILSEIARITSEDVLNKALQRPEIQDTNWIKQFDNLVDAREALKDKVLRAAPARGAQYFNVSARTRSKDDPPKIIDAIIRVYMLGLDEQSMGIANQQRQAYTVERRRIEEQILALNERLTQFTSQEQLPTLDSRHSEFVRLNDTYSQQLASLQLQLESVREMHKMLSERQQQGDAEPSPEDLAAVNALPEVLDLQRRLDNYRESLEDAVTRFGEQHPNASRWRSRIAASERLLENKRQEKLREMGQMRLEQAANGMSSLMAQIQSLQPQLDEIRAKRVDLNQKLTEINRMQTELERAHVQKANVEKLLGELRIYTELPGSKRVTRLTGVTEPELVFPKVQVVIPGVTFFIVMLTAGIIFLLEMIDQRVKEPSDIKLLEDAELLGTLPDAVEDPSGPTGIERVVEKYPNGLMAESFRQVRTAIGNKMDRRGYKTLMVVAASPRSGTSSVTHNLATSLAFHGRNVVIVDANFRRPAQHKLFGLSNEMGLVEVLRGRAQLADAVQKIDGINVSVLTTGHGGDAPPELLEAGSFRSILSELEAQYDIILIDAPPALLTTDSQLLAKHVDAIAAVCRAMVDKRGMIARMMRRLDGQRADLLGLILNGVQSSAGGYFRKSYREFYSYRENGATTSSPDRGAAETTEAR